MTIIDSRGQVDDGTSNLVVAGTSTFGGAVSYTGYASALKVANWYIDFVSGSDSNSGLTSGSALKTFMGGLVGKWGTNAPLLSQSVAVHFLSAQPLHAEAIALDITLLGPNSFSIIGTPSLAYTASLNVVQSKNKSTNAQFICNGFASSSVVNQLVANTTSGKVSTCFIRNVSTGSAGLTQPIATMNLGDNVFLPAPSEVDTWAHNDTVSVFDLPGINLQNINVKCASSSDGSTNPVLWLQYLKVWDWSGAAGNQNFTPSCQSGFLNVADCYVQPYFVLRGVPTYESNLVNCSFPGGEMDHTWIIGGINTTLGLIITSPSWIDGDFVSDGGTFVTGPNVVVANMNVSNVLKGHPQSTIRVVPQAYASAVLWGVGSVDIEPMGLFWNSTGTSWPTAVKVATLTIDALSTATTYATGTFVDNIPITTTNIQFYGGMQNVRTGARYF